MSQQHTDSRIDTIRIRDTLFMITASSETTVDRGSIGYRFESLMTSDDTPMIRQMLQSQLSDTPPSTSSVRKRKAPTPDPNRHWLETITLFEAELLVDNRSTKILFAAEIDCYSDEPSINDALDQLKCKPVRWTVDEQAWLDLPEVKQLPSAPSAEITLSTSAATSYAIELKTVRFFPLWNRSSSSPHTKLQHMLLQSLLVNTRFIIIAQIDGRAADQRRLCIRQMWYIDTSQLQQCAPISTCLERLSHRLDIALRSREIATFQLVCNRQSVSCAPIASVDLTEATVQQIIEAFQSS